MRIALGVKSSFSPIWVKKGPKNLKIFIGFLSEVALNRSKAQAKICECYIDNIPKTFS